MVAYASSTPDKITPEKLKKDLELVGRDVRTATRDCNPFHPPDDTETRMLIAHLNSKEPFEVVMRMFTRRLDISDKHYTAVQIARTLGVIRVLLEIAPITFVEYWTNHIHIITPLQWARAPYIGVSRETMTNLNKEAALIIWFLDTIEGKKDLERRRSFTRNENTRIPQSSSGIDGTIRTYTGSENLTDPRDLLDQFAAGVRDDDDRLVIISMLERRLNHYDTNYTCLQISRSLKIIQHCLPSSETFVKYWVDHPAKIQHLKTAKCEHALRCGREKVDEIHELAVDILARLDHHQRLWDRKNMPLPKENAIASLASLRLGASTPPPPKRDWIPEPKEFTSLGLKDLTRDITLSSLDAAGNGQYSDVYKERIRSTEQQVAIKQLRLIGEDCEVGRAALKKLKRELKIWNSLENHPYINPLLGITYTLMRQLPGFVSPWQANGTLSDYMKRNPDLNRYQFLYKVVVAVKALHENQTKIIHGDIKPGNVLVQANGDPALTDYGLSKIMDDAAGNSTSSGRGTMAYMAPELIKGQPRTEASDIWALGCLCYFMFTGSNPYHEFTYLQIPTEITKGHPKRPRDSKVNDSLWKILVECWREDASERPTASALLKRLENLPTTQIRKPKVHFSRSEALRFD